MMRRHHAGPLIVAAAAFLAFLPALHGGFVTWDDDRNFLGNPHYRGLGWSQLRWMWTTFHMGHYVPLSWMTLGLDYKLWGMNPAGYHLTNLLLHAANAVVLYFVARRIIRSSAVGQRELSDDGLAVGAGAAALLFAIHPLRVESVAWVTERRDVLSGLLYSASVLLYLKAPDSVERQQRWYWLAVIVFAGALLSKATAVTMPAVLFILNVYPLRRLGGNAGWRSVAARRVYVELLPFALLASAAAGLSLVALHPPAQLGIGEKLAVSAYGIGFYLAKTILPRSLSPLYPMPAPVTAMAPAFVAAYAVAIAFTILAWSARRRWPGAAAAAAAFLVITFPMLGLVQNGPQLVADRYTYHAAPAIALLAGGSLAYFPARRVVAVRAIAVGLLVVLAALTWRQTRVWHDSRTLWSQVLRVEPRSSVGHVAMASLLFDGGQVDEAIDHYRRALAIEPEYAEGHNNLGVAFARQGRLAEATEQYRLALRIKPEYDEPYSNWGAVIAHEGNIPLAIEQYEKALALNPDNADAHVNWGNALVRQGRPEEAMPHYAAALRIRPDHADAQHNWGVALAREGRLAEAIEHFRQALAINPAHAEAREYLERATRMLGGG